MDVQEKVEENKHTTKNRKWRCKLTFKRAENTQYYLWKRRGKKWEKDNVLESRKLRELKWQVAGVGKDAPIALLPLALSRAISGP
jgi:hypothetical protein